MVVFGVKTKKNVLIPNYVAEIKNNMLHNPLYEGSKIRIDTNTNNYLISVLIKRPSIIDIIQSVLSLAFFISLIIPWVLSGNMGVYWYNLLIACLIALPEFFVSPRFFYNVMKKGAKKKGYTKEFTYIRVDKLAEKLIF